MNQMDRPEESPLLTLKQAAHRLAISRRTLERLIASRAFPPPLKVLRASRVHPNDIAAYVDKLNRTRFNQGGSNS